MFVSVKVGSVGLSGSGVGVGSGSGVGVGSGVVCFAFTVIVAVFDSSGKLSNSGVSIPFIINFTLYLVSLLTLGVLKVYVPKFVIPVVEEPDIVL